MQVESEYFGITLWMELLIHSYEHHSLEEPAIDCWNVTDGIDASM